MERKAQKATAYRFSWRSPGYLKEAPTLEVTMPDGTVIAPALTLTVIHAEETITAVDEPNWTLTADGNVAAPTVGVTNDRGDAFLRGPEGVTPVRVRDISGATLYLGDSTPAVEMGGDTLQWATYEVAIGAGHDILATAQRNVKFKITYVLEPLATVEHTRVEYALLHVLDRVFVTTLTDHVVRERMASMAEHLPGRAQSFDGYIASALDELVQDHVRPRMASWGLYEDDIHSPERFLRAHLYFTRAALFDDLGDTERAEAARAQGAAAAAQVMAAIVADLDADGTVDDPSSGASFVDAGGGGFPSSARKTVPVPYTRSTSAN